MTISFLNLLENIRDYLTNDTIKDIDVFCLNQVSEEKIISFFRKCGKLINENSSLANFSYKDKWFQIIKGKYYETSNTEVIDNFDFTICQGMLHYVNEHIELKVGDTFYKDCLAKHLRINTIKYPLSTLERMQKYIRKGYTACNGTLLEIAKSLGFEIKDSDNNNTLMFYPDGTPRFLGVD